MKKLIILILFLNSPIFSMGVWNKIKKWVTQPFTSSLPELPSDIQTTEIVKQLLHISNTRDEALTLLNNYAQVNKAIAEYIKENKDTIQKILDQKFGLSLTVLTSGNYNDPNIKAETIKVLQKATHKYSSYSETLNTLITFIKNKNDKITIVNVHMYIGLLARSLLDKDYSLSAALIGVFDNFINHTHPVLNKNNESQFVDLLKGFISFFGKNKPLTQILISIINQAITLFGPNFIDNEIGQHMSKSGTLFNFTRTTGNKAAIKYLETIKNQ
ncbi:MAG: hypothetical protein ACOYT8_04990 [Candidatus Dependentiae bacterium]